MYDKFGERGLREGMGGGGLSFLVYSVVFGKNIDECLFDNSIHECDILSFIVYLSYYTFIITCNSCSLEGLYQELKVIVRNWHCYLLIITQN